MPELAEIVAGGLAGYFEYVGERLNHWVAPLSEEQFWARPYPYGNSVGHLVLHLTGNLNYYIGRQISGTGYIRERDREFTDPEPPSKGQALAGFDQAIAMVIRAIRAQSGADWGANYRAEREPEARDRFQILLRCAGHAYHHVGQIIYLTRELARN